jgi:hypothetical protein
MSDLTPCYLGYCPTCGGLIAASVADPTGSTASMRAALRDREDYRRRGYRVATGTVEDVRQAGRMGHAEDCQCRRQKPSSVAQDARSPVGASPTPAGDRAPLLGHPRPLCGGEAS